VKLVIHSMGVKFQYVGKRKYQFQHIICQYSFEKCLHTKPLASGQLFIINQRFITQLKFLIFENICFYNYFLKESFLGKKNSEIFFPTSATGAGQRQNFRKESFSAETKFRNFSSNQCHWCRPAPKLPQGEFSGEKEFRNFCSNQCHWCQPAPKLLQPEFSAEKEFRNFFLQPVPLVPASVKTSAARVFPWSKKRNTC